MADPEVFELGRTFEEAVEKVTYYRVVDLSHELENTEEVELMGEAIEGLELPFEKREVLADRVNGAIRHLEQDFYKAGFRDGFRLALWLLCDSRGLGNGRKEE